MVMFFMKLIICLMSPGCQWKKIAASTEKPAKAMAATGEQPEQHAKSTAGFGQDDEGQQHSQDAMGDSIIACVPA